ncbi:hypothetical protein F4806DRAFT_495636 [Annulohypoxylon nitens]|nr:hypothetical protein F4806DRAFT_495636 [Annulohypoxylon nitens]
MSTSISAIDRSPTAPTSIPVAVPTRTHLLSLPYEIRYDIYQRCLYDPWGNMERWNLLKVCKQLYEEISPFFFEEVAIGCSPEECKELLHRMGQRNVAKIRHLTITYSCHRPVPECLEHPHEQKGSNWRPIFQMFRDTRAFSRLETLTVHMTPCFDVREDNDGDLSPLIYNHRCLVYRDLQLLMGLWNVKDAKTLSLSGEYHPLWATLLLRNSGYIAKRWYDSNHTTLENPNHPKFRFDVRGYTQSDEHERLYHQNPPSPEYEESDSPTQEPEERDTSDEFTFDISNWITPLPFPPDSIVW